MLPVRQQWGLAAGSVCDPNAQQCFPPTAPALWNSWEIWPMCCGEQLLLLALLEALPLKSIRVDPQSPEITGNYAT